LLLQTSLSTRRVHLFLGREQDLHARHPLLPQSAVKQSYMVSTIVRPSIFPVSSEPLNRSALPLQRANSLLSSRSRTRYKVRYNVVREVSLRKHGVAHIKLFAIIFLAARFGRRRFNLVPATRPIRQRPIAVPRVQRYDDERRIAAKETPLDGFSKRIFVSIV